MKTLFDLNKENNKDEYNILYGECFDLKKIIATPIVDLNNIHPEETKKVKDKDLLVLKNTKKNYETNSASLFEVHNFNHPKGIIKFWVAKSKYTYYDEKELLIMPIWIFNNLQIAPKREEEITPDMTWDALQDEIAIRGGYQSEGFAGLEGDEAWDAFWNCN